MFGIDLLVFVCSIILLVEVYNETFLQNYGSFSERLKHLVSLKMIFKIIKISSFSFLIYLAINKLTRFEGFNELFFRENIFKIEIEKIHLYFIPVLIYCGWQILSNSVKILKQFSFDIYSEGRFVQLTAFLKFIFYRILAFCYTYFLFSIVFFIFLKIDNIFTTNNLRFLDWFYIAENINHNYNTGVYFSLVLTMIIFFLFNNAFIKINSNDMNYRTIEISYFAYLFITIIISIGVFFGFFSIFNAIYNIRVTSFTEWFNKENVIGLLPIRLASVFILFNLFKYIYKETLEKQIFSFLKLALLPIRKIEYYYLTIKIETRETLYFSQIAFYILNIAIAEYFVIIEYKIFYLSILNFAILFIQDDFNIINEYSNGLQSVLKSHFRRIQFFNAIMLLCSALALILTESYYELLIYLILTSILLYLYFYNYSFINSRDYKF